jgi:hypothetical protein
VIESEVSWSSADVAVILSGQAESPPNFNNAWISFGLVASINVGGIIAYGGMRHIQRFQMNMKGLMEDSQGRDSLEM